jgi:hypothetical protein
MRQPKLERIQLRLIWWIRKFAGLKTEDQNRWYFL